MLHLFLLMILHVFTVSTANEYPTYLYQYPFGGRRFLTKNDRVILDRNKRGYVPPTPSYARGQCATTTENDKFPWWQVKLGKAAYITEVQVFSNLPNGTYKIHDLEIRVGNEDIQSSPKNVTFSKNHVCNKLDGAINRKQFESLCEQNLVGNYVTLQITKPCLSYNGCVKNVLNLCEVEVKGYYMDTIQDKSVTLAKKVTARQSSVVLGGNPSLAVDGSFKTQLYKVTKHNLCATIHENVANNYVTYEIILNELYEVKDVTFESTSKIKDHFIIEAFVEYEGLQDLNQKNKEPTKKCGFFSRIIEGKHTISCNPKYLGKSVLLRVKRNCGGRRCPGSVSNGNITNCKFEIHGYPVPNVAEGKDTKQSSTFKGGHSTLAVDGHISGIYLLNGHPNCAHTDTDNFLYPWWRVDLAADYLVDSLLIYNRKEGLHQRLHDIDIRIGDEDINSFYPSSMANKIPERFTKNRICKSFANKLLPPGANNITCDHPLIGRYVSIQITGYCRSSECNERNSNLLTLCEVEVYGFLIDRYTFGNVALGKVPKSGAKNRVSSNKALTKLGVLAALHKYVNGREVKWWQIDLGETHAVTSVEIFTGETARSYFTPLTVEVVVGFANFEHLDSPSVLPFESAAICLAENITLAPILTLSCVGSVIGRYVTILSPGICTNGPCSKIQNLLKVKMMHIWASKLKKDNLEKKVPINWSSGHRIVADESKLQTIYNFTRTPQCTLTATSDEYPWWHVEFNSNVVVYSVDIWNRDDFSHRLHNIEIRVGENDIPRNAGDKPFTFNQVCASKSMALPKGKNTITCSNPVVGRHLTIQMIKKCSAPDCKFEPYNILTLCEVEVKAFSLNVFRKTKLNVALRKETSQSSTGYGRGSNLAVDGRKS